MTKHDTHIIRETTSLTYDEIQRMVNTDQEEVYNFIRNNEGLTSLEIINGLGYESSLKQIRPRITELWNKGLLIYGNKRPSTYSNKPSFEVYSKQGFEQKYLKVLGFKEKEERLYTFEGFDKELNVWFVLYQDFRQGQRKSYAFDNKGNSLVHSNIWIHKTFKALMSMNREVNKSGN